MAGFEAGQLLTADLLNSLIIDRAEVPTNEDLIFVWNYHQENAIQFENDQIIAVAPYNLTVLSCNMVFDDASIPASDTDYWSITLEKILADGATTVAMARRATRVTGVDANGAIVPQVNWSFDGANWPVRDVAAGEVLRFFITPVGAPPAIQPFIAATIRYQRQVL